MTWLFNMNYAHLMIAIGTVLAVLGFLGFVFQQNRNGAPNENRTEMKTNGE
jgi:hypothetical protein